MVASIWEVFQMSPNADYFGDKNGRDNHDDQCRFQIQDNLSVRATAKGGNKNFLHKNYKADCNEETYSSYCQLFPHVRPLLS
jgi:hypothetical protein